jgi:hypothetical protein
MYVVSHFFPCLSFLLFQSLHGGARHQGFAISASESASASTTFHSIYSLTTGDFRPLKEASRAQMDGNRVASTKSPQIEFERTACIPKDLI